MVTPLLQNLRRFIPRARICLAAPPPIIDLLKPSGLCDEFLSFPTELGGVGSIRQFIRGIRRLNDLGLCTTFVAYPDDAEDIAVLRSFVHFGVTVGVSNSHYAHRAYDISLPWDKDMHEAEVNVNLARAVGIPAMLTEPRIELTSGEEDWAKNMLRELIPADRTRVAIHCGAARGQEFKAWPQTYYGHLIKLLKAKPFFQVLLFGGKGEVEPTRSLVADCEGKVLDLVGQFSIRQTAALLAQCQIVVGGDTGVMHVAAALGIPVCAIFGPTNSNRVRPGFGGDNVDLIRGRCGCGDLYHFGRPTVQCVSEWSCLREIPPELVFETVVKRLGSWGVSAKTEGRLC